MKRSSSSYGAAATAKRPALDPDVLERLADLPNGLDFFSDPRAAAKAKASGLLRNYGAKDKWLEAEPLVLQAHAALDEGEELDEETLLEFVPQLQAFEPETLEAMLALSRRHANYERAARTLLERQAERLHVAHERELRALRLELESDKTRLKATTEESKRSMLEATSAETALHKVRHVRHQRHCASDPLCRKLSII